MKKIFLFFLIMIVGNTLTFAQNIEYKNLVINFKDNWQVKTGERGELFAMQMDKKKAFMVSIYYPKSVEEGMQYLIASQQIPKQTLIKTDGVKLIKEDIDITLDNGYPFQGNVFTTNNNQRFLVTASLGSNVGIVLVTYEGEGNDIDNAINEFRDIANSIVLKGTH